MIEIASGIAMPVKPRAKIMMRAVELYKLAGTSARKSTVAKQALADLPDEFKKWGIDYQSAVDYLRNNLEKYLAL